MKSHQIDRERINFVSDPNSRIVLERVPLAKSIDEFPDFFIVGVKNVGAVHVNVDAFDFLRIRIAGDMLASVNQ